MQPKNKKKDEIKKVQQETKQDTSDELDVSEKSEIISKKKVVYAEIDDEVTVIFNKISAVRAKHVYIVVPSRAILFQSVVNLKILKRKAEDDGKTIYFITNDKNGVYLAQQIGIAVYNKSNEEGKPALFSTEANDEKLRITPLKATINSIEEEAPTRLTERKISISEILNKKKHEKPVDISKIDLNKPEKKKEKQKFVIVAPNRHALIGLIVLSVFILLVIVYIALPGATIYLTPSATVLEKSVNITLADYQKNRVELETHPTHMISSYPINTTVEKSITQYSTGKKFSERGANSKGKLTVINTSSAPWPLVAQTRFQTNEGIVFRISSGITVPGATSAGPGKLEVFVTADTIDANGSIVGERGNISPSKFFLPGLKESSRSVIYGESYEPMTGGITDFISYISEEDITAAKSRLNDELLKSAVAELRDAVNKKGELVGKNDFYTLLEGEGAIKIGDVSIDIPIGLSGREVAEFSVSGKVTVSGVYYDHDGMVEILKSELLMKKSPQKDLLRINEDSTSYRIFEWDEGTGKIKLTANIKGIEQFSIDPKKESGQKLLKKISDHIAGKDIESAKQFIQNLPEINKVEIDSWPAWSPTIPNLAENIDYEIRDSITVE